MHGARGMKVPLTLICVFLLNSPRLPVNALTCDDSRIIKTCSVGGNRKCEFPAQYSDGVRCVNTTQCNSDEYLVSMIRIDANFQVVQPLKCNGYSSCGPGQYLSFDGRIEEASNNECSDYSPECGENEVELKAPTPTSDRQCGPIILCNSLTSVLVERNGVQTCELMSTCSIDTQFLDLTRNECMQRSHCNPGSEPILPLEITQDTRCGQCVAGTYSENGTSCEICEPGTFASEVGQSACIQYTSCPFVTNFPLPTADVTCVQRVPSGPSPTSCGDNFVEKNLHGTPAKICDECVDGFWLNASTAWEYLHCVECGINEYCHNNLRHSCPSGGMFTREGHIFERYHESTHAVGDISDCICSSVGGFRGVPYSVTGCMPCESGSFSNFSTNFQCHQCPMHTFSMTQSVIVLMDNGSPDVNIEVGASECKPCPSDKPYTLTEGATGCVQCPPEYYQPYEGGGCLKCIECGENQYEKSECTVYSDRECHTCDPDTRPKCAPGFSPQPCGPNYGGCVECLNSKPSNALWVDPSDGFYCGWKCGKGFYQKDTNCEPCTDLTDMCPLGYTPSECRDIYDSTCSQCQNSTKPLVNSEWLENTCNWVCSGGRVAKTLSSGGFFCSF